MGLSRYFLNKEKKNYANKTLYRIEDQQGQIITESTKILDEVKQFYAELYTEKKEKGQLDETYINKLDIPCIPQDLREQLDLPIEMKEISSALSCLANNKSPGCDGIPPDFYKVFFPRLKDFLFGLYSEIVLSEELHLSAKRGILSLLEKVNKNPLKLKHWRPLTLLNSDQKIFSKLLALRLEKSTKFIIHHSQMGFAKQRHITENILKIMEIISVCDRKKIDGILVSFDFFKAFDTVSWNAIFLALERFGFGPFFIKMVKILFTQPLVCASNNGYWLEFFELTQSTRQRCCFSPGIFNIIVELLGIGIRQNKNIKGISLNKEEIKSGQFADDLWTSLIATPQNLNEMLSEIEKFGRMSGLTINPDKCAILKLGPFKESDAKFYTLKQLYWSPGPIRILGIEIHTYPLIMQEVNFGKAINKGKEILQSWSKNKLTLIGKITVINCLVNSLFSHLFLALPTPSQTFFTEYKSMIVEFLWDGKKAKIAYSKLIQDYYHLGLKLVDLATKDNALKASWPVRWKDRGNQIKWIYELFPIKDERIWECNISCQDINKLQIGMDNRSTLGSIWKAWAKLTYKETCLETEEILESMIWGNSLIRMRNQPIFDTKIVDSNIDKILDIFDPVTKKFHSFEQIIEIFGKKLNYLQYCGIRAAIPNLWKIVLKQENMQNVIDMETKVGKLDKGINTSRSNYWILLVKAYPPNQGARITWEKDLESPILEEDWWEIFPNFLKQVKPAKLRCFQYRVLTRSLTVNTLRNKWDKTISAKCTFCKENDETIPHILFYCREVQELWKNIARTILYFLKVQIKLDVKTVILNNYKGPCKELINMLIVTLKQYIYAKKCFEEKPNYPTPRSSPSLTPMLT